MTFTVEQAIAELKSNTSKYSTASGLIDLIKSTDADSKGAVTVLYSRKMSAAAFGSKDFVASTEVLNGMVANGDDVRIVDHTAAAELVGSLEFKQALSQATGVPIEDFPKRDNPANDFLYGKTVNGVRQPTGAWDVISANFIDNTVGSVRTLTPNSDANSTFAQVEVPHILNNTKITDVDGITHEGLKQVYQKTGIYESVRQMVSAASYDHVSTLKIAVDSSGTPLKLQTNGNDSVRVDTRAFFENVPGIEGHAPPIETPMKYMFGMLPPASSAKFQHGFDLLHGYRDTLQAQANLVGDANEATRVSALKALGKLGTAGDILGFSIMMGLANQAYAAGDTQKGNQLIENWAVDFAGGAAGAWAWGTAAMVITAPLASLGPIGMFASGVITLAAGIAGGIWGGDVATSNWSGKISDGFGKAEQTTSPLILDLDGDGVETLSKNISKVRFDLDGNRFIEQTGWVGKDDGLLVRDLNNDGKISSGRELFGNFTQLKDGKNAANGFEALKELDSNADGVINASDAGFATLKIWKDTNSNAVVDAGELMTLTQAGVKSMNVGYSNINITYAQGNMHLQRGAFVTTSGQTRQVDDVWFTVDGQQGIDAQLVVESAAIKALPNLVGHGQVADLHQAMARDTSGRLVNVINQFVQAKTIDARQALVDDIVFTWAGVQGVDPASRPASAIYGNAIGDARKLEALEAFVGKEYLGVWCSGKYDPNPHAHAAPLLLQAYDALSESIYHGLLQVTHYKSTLDAIQINFDGKTVSYDVSTVVEQMRQAYLKGADQGLLFMYDFYGVLSQLGETGNTIVTQLRSKGNVGATGFLKDLAQLGLLGNIATIGSDVLKATSNSAAFLSGLGGDDNLYGASGNDELIGGAGADYLAGAEGSDIYRFSRGYGQDTIYDYGTAVGTDRLMFAADILPADIQMTRTTTDLTLSIKNTTDKVTLQNYFSSGEYLIEQIVFGNGVIWDKAFVMKEIFKGTVGNDSLVGFVTNDLLDGWLGNDSLFGDDGNDTLNGDVGTDQLDGGYGNDILNGGIGNDTLEGGAGNDVYMFGKGDGQDLIEYSSDSSTTRLNVLQFKAGVLPSEVMFKQVSDNYYGYQALEVSIAGTMDKITIRGMFYNSQLNTSYSEMQQFKFADGTVWDLTTICNRLFAGTSGDDNIYGVESNDRLTGGLGNDGLNGNAGNDTLDGDAGNDSLSGGSGDDMVNGGADKDSLFGDDGNDTLNGDVGTDQLDGGYGNDILNGGIGNDTLEGGAGNDVYMFGKGDGQDLIEYSSDSSTTRLNVLQFKAGVLPSEVMFKQVSDNYYGYQALEVSIAGTMDKITIRGMFYNSQLNTSYSEMQQFKFADGTVWDLTTICNRLFAGTSGDDNIYGVESNDRLTGGLGNDGLNGNAGNDTLDGDAGNDSLSGGSGDDMVNGGADKDSLFGDDGNDTLNGDVGTDQLDGGYGNDILNGGIGNDTLEGGAGNDVYMFGKGDGQDLIEYSSDSSTTRLNVLQFKAGVLPSEVMFKQVSDNYYGYQALEVSIAGTMDKITIRGMFYNSQLNTSYSEMQQFKFADGTVWDLTTICNRLFAGTSGDDNIYGVESNDRLTGGLGNDGLNGNAGNDTLDGDAGNDSLSGGSGDDMVNGGADKDSLFGDDGNDTLNGDVGTDQLDGGYGNDILNGGIGNDTLEGGAGNDVYMFGKGDGQDLIEYSSDSSTTRLNVLQFKAGVLPSEVMFKQVSDNYYGYQALEVSIAGTMDKITIRGMFYNSQLNTSYSEMQQFKFADGTVWDLTTICNRLFAGTSGDDNIYGVESNDRLTGGLGNDGLNGNAGNDTLDGGVGLDVLTGSAGSDAFVFSTELIGSTNKDSITDFVAVDDVIYLENAVFSKLSLEGALDVNFFKASANGVALDGNDYILYNTTTGELSYDADGNGANAAVSFAVLGAGAPPVINHLDFVVI